MRKYLLLLVGLMLVFPALIFSQGLLKISHPMRIITYNIRYDNPGDNQNNWDHRKEKVVSVLGLYHPDIFGLQEALWHQLDYIDKAFAEYAYCGVGRDDGVKAGEFSPVFYNTNRYTALEQGTFWLSETPDKPGSTGWYATIPRIATWVKLHDRTTGTDFFVFNTHFDHASQHAREQSALLIRKKIRTIAGDAPVILTGDFNTREGTTAYNTINTQNEPPGLVNTQEISELPHHGPTCSFVGFDFIVVPGRVIDFIFSSPKIKVVRHAILSDNWDGVYPSDHLPVLVDVEVEGE